MPQELIRESFRNIEALRQYRKGELPGKDKLKQFIYNGIRARQTARPDHLLKNRQQLLAGDSQHSMVVYLRGILKTMADRYIDPAGHARFLVPTAKFAEWQSVITEVPPLLAVCWQLLQTHGKPPLGRNIELDDYFQRCIKPQLRHSALPTICDPRLDELIDRIGLDDLHMHLNGSSEIEGVWRNALSHPHQFSKALMPAQSNQDAIELLSHDEMELDQSELLIRLRIAGRLRSALLAEVMDQQVFTAAELTRLNQASEFNGGEHSPLSEFAEQVSHIATELKTPLALEAVFLMLMFNHLDTSKNESFAHGLYYYLLIKCQFMRLIVQQTSQYGFDQFQKITFNEMRSTTERRYTARYHQLAYSEQGDVEVLEGRFAPKDDVAGNRERLLAIMQGYDEFHQLENKRQGRHQAGDEALDSKGPSPSLRALLKPDKQRSGRLKLSLIAHFIKQPDKAAGKIAAGQDLSISWRCRHYELRNKIDKTRRAILALNRRYADLSAFLHGFDAAANELHAGPEVFAPVFRRLRKDGYHHFTYHAGEDYVHLLSGIRTVHEAIAFLDLKTGNRIGHGTAVGIDPGLWRQRTGPTIVMKCGDRLDDLVYAHRQLIEVGGHHKVLLLLERDIRQLSHKVYGEPKTPELLYEAWELRYLDPVLVFELKLAEADYLRPEIVQELEQITKTKADQKEAFALFAQYHGIGNTDWVKNAEKLIEVDVADPCEKALSQALYRDLQKQVLAKVRRRHMAIESLPTSNLRISFYQKFAEHHIFNWLGAGDEQGMEVPVVLGSDDPGIFSTNLRNEYAHVLIELSERLPAIEAIAKLEQLARNGKIWRFAKGEKYQGRQSYE